ncbi:MAG: SHOCT domain-containing protein [Candidatus Hermodarchaeia archaeon]|jgi:putative membrane protein
MMLGFGFVGIIFMVLFWGVLIAGAILLVRALFPRGQRLDKPESTSKLTAAETLDLRYARGEIDREEYELKKADLTG